MKPIFIAFGANLSNPKATFLEAVRLLESKGVTFERMSGLWQSPAWPSGSGAPDYVNAVVSVRYSGTPERLMTLLLETETELGRVRSVKNAPRTLDLDLLVWGQEVRDTGHLLLPHPRMLERPFVLLPLSEIAPDWTDQVQGQGAFAHLARLRANDVLALTRISDFPRAN